MQDDMTDLSALNTAEREILRLLAQGHTAKSVADLTGRSVGSVNERLRDARRKTGVSSSRALSRALSAQENRDDLIGVDPVEPVAPELPEAGGPSRSALFRGVAMTIVAAIALTAGAYLLQSAPSVPRAPIEEQFVSPAKDDPLLAGSLFGPTPSERYVIVRAEKRDGPWADKTEKALIARYAVLLSKYGVHQPVRALCGDASCEIAMKLNLSSDQVRKLMNELQNKELADSLAKIGLTGATASFGGPDKSFVHSSYWLRKSAVSAAPASAGQAPGSP
ncbi:helix-turn-helix transcriptional regulator [Sphingobium sp.]|uniref:helix-turn-helix transcriptional regulator n=1 Tax=Sphingobium sp. TaxID=1912891 RepID=UPI00262B3917|nr:helix-turn-helix transcriptional regulator [Sphingobium sp.]